MDCKFDTKRFVWYTDKSVREMYSPDIQRLLLDLNISIKTLWTNPKEVRQQAVGLKELNKQIRRDKMKLSTLGQRESQIFWQKLTH